jgi:RNA polymerase sigma-70 factor, ECF subfamily
LLGSRGLKLKQAMAESYQLNNEAASALLQRIGTGDPAALGILYDKTNRLLFGLVLKIIEDRTAAEEVLLDVYTRVWKQAACFNPKILSPLEWLIMLARSRAIAILHWGKKHKKSQIFPANETEPANSVAPERQKLARDSIASLGPAQREILDWALYSGLSCAEIAAQTGKPLGAIKTHVRLGLSKLAEAFQLKFKNDPQPGDEQSEA